MPAEHAIVAKNLSRKDFNVVGGVAYIKDAAFVLITDNGAGNPAVYNVLTQLNYWVQPTNDEALIDAVATVVFFDGFAFFKFTGSSWDLISFVPNSSFVLSKPPYYASKALATVALGVNKMFLYSELNFDGAVGHTQAWT